MGRQLGFVVLLLSACIRCWAQDDFPETLEDDGTWSLKAADVSTSPARIDAVIAGGASRRLVLGKSSQGFMLTSVSKSRTRWTVGSRQDEAGLDEAVLWDESKRKFTGASSSSAAPTTATSLPRVVTVATRVRTGRPVALVQSGTIDRVVAGGDFVGAWLVESANEVRESALSIESDPSSVLACRGRLNVRQTVVFRERRPSPARFPDRQVRWDRELTNECWLDEPVSSSIGQNLRLLAVTEAGEAVVSLRGETVAVISGDTVGRWRIDRPSRNGEFREPNQRTIEHSVVLTDLYRGTWTRYRVRDHFRGDVFEYRDDPLAEQQPVTLGTPAGVDLPELGF